nr:hypothetical protein [Tanacetum cinerariifolium]GEW56579.1 hypothetical protein [Tanacetum cinerariifolium]
MYHPQRASPPQNQSSPILVFNLNDDNLEPLWDSASHPSQYMEGPSELVEYDFPVEEVTPLCVKLGYRGRRIASKEMEKSRQSFRQKPFKMEKIEMPKFYKSKQIIFQKIKDTKTTSQSNSDSAHIGLNLNDEAADSMDVNVQEVKPMGQDRAKKKASSYGARSKTSIAESELELDDQKRWEQGELKGLKIAKRDKELDIQQKIVRISTTTKMGGGHQVLQ